MGTRVLCVSTRRERRLAYAKTSFVKRKSVETESITNLVAIVVTEERRLLDILDNYGDHRENALRWP